MSWERRCDSGTDLRGCARRSASFGEAATTHDARRIRNQRGETNCLATMSSTLASYRPLNDSPTAGDSQEYAGEAERAKTYQKNTHVTETEIARPGADM